MHTLRQSRTKEKHIQFPQHGDNNNQDVVHNGERNKAVKKDQNTIIMHYDGLYITQTHKDDDL